MKRALARVVLAAAVAGGAVSCTRSSRELSQWELRQHRQQFWQSQFRPVTYRVADPPAVNERIVVREDGVVEMSGRLFGTALQQLPAAEVARLAENFRDWEELGPEYDGSGDAQPVEELTYGGKTVRVRGTPRDLPAAYTRARAALIEAARKMERGPS